MKKKYKNHTRSGNRLTSNFNKFLQRGNYTGMVTYL